MGIKKEGWTSRRSLGFRCRDNVCVKKLAPAEIVNITRLWSAKPEVIRAHENFTE